MDQKPVLERLMEVVLSRRTESPDRSYTARLLRDGVSVIAGKVLEEAEEVAEAAGEPGEGGKRHLIHEAADLTYHLLVLLAARDLSLRDVEDELQRRFGISGLKEKAQRGVAFDPGSGPGH